MRAHFPAHVNEGGKKVKGGGEEEFAHWTW
jgi:hypothetical protein